MKKRVTAMLIVLTMLLGLMPGTANADQRYTFSIGENIINGLENGKAVAGSTISFKPLSIIESDDPMLEAFFDIGDYKLEIDDDEGMMYNPYPYIDSNGVCEIQIPDKRDIAGDKIQIIFIFDAMLNTTTFVSESIDAVCDLTKHGSIMDYGEPRVYNGKAQTQQVSAFYQSMGIDEGTDYTVSYKDNINAGTASLTVTGKGGFIGSITKTFEIEKADILNTDISGISTKTYTGSPIEQAVTVKADGETLTSGKDYTVSYKNNTNVGTASVTITGKDNCTGSVTKTFQIDKAANLMSTQNKTVKIKASKLKNKRQIIKCSRSMGICTAVGKLQFELLKVNKKKFKKYFKVNANNGNIIIRKGLKKGIYKLMINVTASGDGNYLPGSAPVTVTIKVK